ncbi:hypothetical protein [uncultured Roseibium sp.]|uniref:hypothetical protein n=1 Tax=uncultured Roseibium sp. TaxID=1936171 RepID=UPI003217CCA7
MSDVLLRLVSGHEIQGQLGMVLLLRSFATPLRHILAAFSMTALTQSSRKRLANSFVAMAHRGSWFCTDDRSHATFPGISSMRPSSTAGWISMLSWSHEHPILTMPVKSHQRCVLGLGWRVRTPHHLRDTDIAPTENMKTEV